MAVCYEHIWNWQMTQRKVELDELLLDIGDRNIRSVEKHMDRILRSPRVAWDESSEDKRRPIYPVEGANTRTGALPIHPVKHKLRAITDRMIRS